MPIDIVKQSHELEVQSDAINEVINKILETIEKHNFQPAGPPIFNLLLMIKTLIKNQISWLRAEIELFPEITLPNLSELVVKVVSKSRRKILREQLKHCRGKDGLF